MNFEEAVGLAQLGFTVRSIQCAYVWNGNMLVSTRHRNMVSMDEVKGEWRKDDE